MRGAWRWFRNNADNALALALATVVSVLGLLDLVSAELVNKAIPVTLAVFAFTLLRDRDQVGRAGAELARSTTAVQKSLAVVDQELATVHQVGTAVTALHGTLEDLTAVRMLRGPAISEALREARADTDVWMFKGGTGTFTRLVTLPDCIRRARAKRNGLRVSIEILDPTDLRLCEDYVKLYQQLAEDPSDNEMSWSALDTQSELYATILAASWYQQRYHSLDIRIDICLSRTYSTLRWDLSRSALIVTQRGPSFPAMLIERDKPHYASWRTELWTSFRQGRQLPAEAAAAVVLDERPTPEQADRLFRALGIGLDSAGGAGLEGIVSKAFHDEDPHTRGAGDNRQPDPATSAAPA